MSYALREGYTLKAENITSSVHTIDFFRNRWYTVSLKKVQKVYAVYPHIPSTKSLGVTKFVSGLSFISV